MSAPPRLRFSKMHGAGNDFVILDRRGDTTPLATALATRLADRHFGVGCDQVITIEDPRIPDVVARYAIWNADGSGAMQCGNGARCVAAWLRRDGSAPARHFRLEGPAGPIAVEADDHDATIRIDMGEPDFAPGAIGLAGTPGSDPVVLQAADACLELGAVSIGNPHAVLEVADVERAEVARLGPLVQTDPRFTRGCNVGFAQVLTPDRLRLRVYERGAGETLACGSGACAAVAVLAQRGRVGPEVAVTLPGGTLQIAWRGPGHPIWMAGPAEFVFEGEFAA